MPIVNFSGVRVNVPEEVLNNPQELENIHRQVSFVRNVDTESGAPADLRAGLAGLSKPEDQVNFLRSKGLDAAMTHQGLAYKDPRSGRPILADEAGFSARDLIDLAPDVGSVAGSILGALGGAAVGAPTGPGAVATSMAGAGAGAAGGRELTTGLLRLFTGADDERTSRQVLGDVATEFALGAAGEGVGRAIGAGVHGLRGGFSPDEYRQLTSQLAKAADVNFGAAQAVPGQFAQRAERYAMQSPISRPRMERALAEQQNALKTGLQNIGEESGFIPHGLRETPELKNAAWADETLLHQNKNFPRVDQLANEADRVSARRFADADYEAQLSYVTGKLNDLGINRPDFNARDFLQKFNALPDADRAMLGLSGELGKELNALIRVAKSVEEQQVRMGKPMATPVGDMLNVLGVTTTYMTGGVPGAIAGAVAPYVTARLLTWPAFVKFLSRPVDNPGQFARRFGRLAAQALRAGYGDEISALRDALLQGQQNSQEK